MKLTSTLLLFFFLNYGFAQNFTDTIAVLNCKLSPKAEKLKKQAQKQEKKATKQKEKWSKALAKVINLEKQAESITNADEKKLALQKALVQRSKTTPIEIAYLQKTEGFLANYLLCMLDIFKHTPNTKNKKATELANELEGHALKKIKKGKSKRKKGKRTDDKETKLEALREAVELEHEAISDLVYATQLLQGKIKMIEPESFTASAFMGDELHFATASIAASSPAVTQNEKPFEEINIIYKVQIAASKEELSGDKIFSLYTPKAGERIYNEIDGPWYKYTVGRFHSYAEALAFKNKIQVKGAFIVAYKDNKKIELPELKNKSNIAKTNSTQKDIIFRIQVAATRQPSNILKMKALKLNGRSVSIIQKDGWYKYLIGDFDTEQKAQDSLTALNNPDAFVVGYSIDGEEIKLK